MHSAVARLTGFRVLLRTMIVFVWAISANASQTKPLGFISGAYLPHPEGKGDDKAPEFTIEVLRQVFAAMGQDVSFEYFPTQRAWRMILRGERDGISGVLRTSERERICLFPDEPVERDRSVLFVRSADVGKLKFSSFADLVGHDVAVVKSFLPGSFEYPSLSPELSKFLLRHHNMVETSGAAEGLRMLTAGRVDYAVMDLLLGNREIRILGLSGKVEPLLSRSVTEQEISVCFAKASVSPSFVGAFSRALRQFKQTEAFQAIHR